MAIPSVNTLSDSDNENNNILSAAYPSDSNNESNQSEPMEVENPTSENVYATEEEDPEEESPEEQNLEEENTEEEEPEEENPMEHTTESEETISETPIPPPTHAPTHTSGPRVIRTARKRVAIPRRRRTTHSESSDPSTNSYHTPNSTTHRRVDARRWTWLPETLQRWREEEGFPIITEMGESSTTHREYPLTREPPHHTTPLIVARMATQETRLDHIEDALEAIPGTEAYENLGGEVHSLEQHLDGICDRVTSLENHFVEVGELAQAVAVGEQETSSRTRSLESQMARMEQNMIRMQGHIDHLTAMAAASREREVLILRGDYLPKKD